MSSRGGIRYAQFFTSAMVAFAVINACYMNVITSTTLARDEGILKRIRSTPLPPWIYMTGRIVSSGLVALVSAIVVIAVGVGVYDFEIVWSAIPAALLTLAAAMFCFCSLGLAVTVLVPAADSALPVAWGTILPLCFISDVFQPIDSAPQRLRGLASFFPVSPFADDLESAFNPITGGRALHPGHFVVLTAWGLAAATFALLAFRWEPERSRERRGWRGPAAFALDRLHRLHTVPELPSQPPARPGSALRARTPSLSRRRDLEPAATERIEGPAPSEDSSVPAEAPETPPVSDRSRTRDQPAMRPKLPGTSPGDGSGSRLREDGHRAGLTSRSG